MAKSLVIVALATVFVAFQNCGGANSSSGTETGNVNARNRIASSLVKNLCGRINACYPQLTEENCMNELFALNNVPHLFGANEGVANNLATLDILEANGTVAGSLQNYLVCAPRLNQISCSDPHMQALTYPFSALEVSALVSGFGECGNLFSP